MQTGYPTLRILCDRRVCRGLRSLINRAEPASTLTGRVSVRPAIADASVSIGAMRAVCAPQGGNGLKQYVSLN